MCIECKIRGTVCVMVAHGTPCLGPVTHAGCGAICPAYDRGCYGCFGPKETPNTDSLSDWFEGLGVAAGDLVPRYRHVTAFADAFAAESRSREAAHRAARIRSGAPTTTRRRARSAGGRRPN